MSLDKNSGPVHSPAKKRMSFFAAILFFGLGILSAFGYMHWKSAPKENAAGNMKSAQVEKVAETKKEPKILYYVDPMNPSNKTDKPGKAPCGMDMVPVYEDEQSTESQPPGTVKISPEKQQLIGVQFGETSEIQLSKTVRAVGRAAFDETRIHHIHTRFEGYVDKVFVDFTGKLVKKGQPLISVYSPELVATQQELLVAKKSADILKKSQFEGIGSQSASLYKSTRERLRLWEINDQQIREIEQHGSPIQYLTINSHIDGFVIARNVFAGHQVKPEMELYTIADLSDVWIIAEVYEYEIEAIRLGQTALVTFPSFPGKVFTGKVTYISPELDPKTRTAKIRIELPNKDFSIKPDMYANVELKADFGRKLSIPQEAVLDSGTSQIVFVAREGGYFEPRKVTLGPKVDNRFIVLAGLTGGEKVVTSANFLIDSESQLKSATGSMALEEHAGHAQTGGQAAPAKEGEHAGHTQAPAAADSGAPKADHSGHTPSAAPPTPGTGAD